MALDDYDDHDAFLTGVILAFIVPTRKRTCGYACPKCIFRLQNQKQSPRDFAGDQLTPDLITEMIETFVREHIDFGSRPLAQLSIQGLNPFYDDLAQECSKRILAMSCWAPVGFVSSGDGVRECMDVIADAHATAYISIDAGPDKNPVLRPAVLPNGRPDPSRNSYDVATDALRALCEVDKQRDRAFAACTVMPKQAGNALDLVETFPDDLCEYVPIVFSPYISI